MPNVKVAISVIAVILTFVGYVPYFRNIFKGTTKPHAFSWFIWGITTSIIYVLQVKGRAGAGSWVTLSVAVIMFIIFFFGLKFGEKNFKKIDFYFLVSALVAIPLWLVVEEPVLSMVLLSLTEMLGFAPTIRKTWDKPYTETLSTYTINGFRHILSIFALAEYNVLTWLFPVSWVAMNFIFVIIIFIRRKRIHPAYPTVSV